METEFQECETLESITSEGGTGEDWRIDPHLNFGNFRENNNNIWKKLVQILT